MVLGYYGNWPGSFFPRPGGAPISMANWPTVLEWRIIQPTGQIKHEGLVQALASVHFHLIC
eukprot:1453225-Prorocentrum_lima.AAC.1